MDLLAISLIPYPTDGFASCELEAEFIEEMLQGCCLQNIEAASDKLLFRSLTACNLMATVACVAPSSPNDLQLVDSKRL